LDDLEQFAIVAHLLGRDEESRDLLSRGYPDAIRTGRNVRAARFAFWVAHGLIFESRMSEASGWIARAQQLMAGQDREHVEHGYLRMWSGIEQLQDGEFATALATLAEAESIATRCGDLTLRAGARYLRGRAYIWSGRVAEGMQLLDEVMVSVIAGEVSPLNVGHTFCGVLEACHEVLDLRRAREWTGALSRWCESQPDLVPYRGPCQVYRAEVMQFHGAWVDALAEAQQACAWLSQPASPEGPADAFYRVGELHRLRGEYAAAEEAYRQASRLGRRPDPGLPLLWLAQGRVQAAHTALHRALAEETGPGLRAELLDAAIQALLAAGDVAAARSLAGELREIATTLGAPLVRARCLMAEGAAALAEHAPDAALGPLRRAWREWQRLEAPYEAARARLLIGCAYRDLGDLDSAAMEFDAARWVFHQLGALPDLAGVEALASPAGAKQTPGGLTLRELDVLRLIADGQTNKEIAAALVISEHTVARHVQNMLAKLGCASRAALAAFAVEHGLARPGRGQL
ncbi:MAG TPA: LuxR C-terminal-related transcriptional regulator, partial [Dehalococcoidia bacterium]|nr:LuxR C-terminal-related transcriptional regulator [Dehalococcoidia bacterium]